ncbi:MAG: biotin/lipoyl-binding protein, partial [Kangiellaceae bacterium]|nr:biotin/lipoyl-binding protein [Kangiellaceae bacterium]
MSAAQPSPPAAAFSIRGRIIAGAACAALLVGGVGGWAATASLSGAVIVQGTVAVDQNLKVIQHRDGGIVGDILVRSGDHVAEGQVMFRLEDAQTRAELSIVRGQIGELRARKARLEAEREGLPAPVFPDDLLADPALAEIIAGERRIFSGSASARLSRVQQLELGIAQIENEISGLESQLVSKEREIALVTEEHGKLDQLSGKKLITGNRI